jgi:predicted DNA-binding transcriptional regulator AlpA
MSSSPKLVTVHGAEQVSSSAGRRLLTAENVAQITGLSTETLAQWRSQRRGIPFVKLSRNVVRYREVDLDAWLSERIVPVEQDPNFARRRG